MMSTGPSSAMNTRLLAMAPTSQPKAAAASAALRVEASSWRTSAPGAISSRTTATAAALGWSRSPDGIARALRTTGARPSTPPGDTGGGTAPERSASRSATDARRGTSLDIDGWSADVRLLHGVADEHLGSEPAPVDAVDGDAPGGELHDLADVDLVAFRRGPQVLPAQGTAVPQVAPAAVPPDELVGPAPSSLG